MDGAKLSLLAASGYGLWTSDLVSICARAADAGTAVVPPLRSPLHPGPRTALMAQSSGACPQEGLSSGHLQFNIGLFPHSICELASWALSS